MFISNIIIDLLYNLSNYIQFEVFDANAKNTRVCKQKRYSVINVTFS